MKSQLANAIRAANWWLQTATLQELHQYAFDRLVNELEEDDIFRHQLLREMDEYRREQREGDPGDEQSCTTEG